MVPIFYCSKQNGHSVSKSFFKVRLQDLWDVNCSVLLLVVFQDGQQSSAYGQAAAVQGMNKAAFPLSFGTVADSHAASLEIQEV